MKNKEVKLTIPQDIADDFKVWCGSLKPSQGFIDLWRYAIHNGFNPNNIKPKAKKTKTIFDK